MAALLHPTYRRGEPAKWGLVFYTMIMFSLATMQTVMDTQLQSISYIDNREFPGIEGEIPSGPFGYLVFAIPEATNVASMTAFYLNAWLADGLLVSSLLDATFTHPGV